ncbi:MAG TPA: ATP-binding cassette domain-containing protein [Cytophagaceae bacterium]|nr:ATP-binding cassette domain-containing protein [Cytophagaceae bacterium]
MEIIAENIGKKFNKEWIFRRLSFSLTSSNCLAITGPNGSGKSTLLQILAGALPASEGTVQYQKGKMMVHSDDMFQYISYAAPYMELVEEMSIRELADFHKAFKPFTDNISTDDFLSRIMLEKASHKEIRFLSSGMKQRVKLGLALYSDTPILILDEPTMNLDNKGIEWYLEEIKKQLHKKIILIGSNQSYEYDFCDQEISITSYLD